MTKKVPISGGRALASDAFAGLNRAGLPAMPAPAATPDACAYPVRKHGARVHLRMEKSGRSGKAVTVIFGAGVSELDAASREGMLRRMKGALGCGGAVCGETVELQGDVRERVRALLVDAGFRVG